MLFWQDINDRKWQVKSTLKYNLKAHGDYVISLSKNVEVFTILPLSNTIKVKSKPLWGKYSLPVPRFILFGPVFEGRIKHGKRGLCWAQIGRVSVGKKKIGNGSNFDNGSHREFLNKRLKYTFDLYTQYKLQDPGLKSKKNDNT